MGLELGRLNGHTLGYPGPIWQGSQTCSLHALCPIWILALALQVPFSRPETGPIYAPASCSPPEFLLHPVYHSACVRVNAHSNPPQPLEPATPRPILFGGLPASVNPHVQSCFSLTHECPRLNPFLIPSLVRGDRVCYTENCCDWPLCIGMICNKHPSRSSWRSS